MRTLGCRLWLAAGLAMTFSGLLRAQDIRVEGSVRDAATGERMPFANVALMRPADTVFLRGATTDGEGRFVIDGVDSGAYLLQASFVGYATFAEPCRLVRDTAGVDIGTKQDIYKLLEEVRDMGRSVILYSTEDNEMEICDRVYVMRDGQITKELSGEDINVPNIVAASFIDTGKKNLSEKKRGAFSRLLDRKSVV